jgi:hypothetical protein
VRRLNPLGASFQLFLLLACTLGVEPLLFGRNPAPSGGDVPRFAVGERLVFRVEWNPPWYLFFLPAMEAGEVEVKLAEEFQYQGTKALKIVFNARSSGALASLAGIKIDDQFEYITDAETLCTMEAREKIREGKRKRDVEVVYLPESNRLHIREVDLSVVPNIVKKDEFKENVPKCVQDVFSALLTLRQREFTLGMTHRSALGNADKVKEVEATVEKKEAVTTPFGKFEAWRLNTVALLGSLFREGGQFRIWLSADKRRLPVQFEAKVHLGKVTGKLKSVSSPQLQAGSTEDVQRPGLQR